MHDLSIAKKIEVEVRVYGDISEVTLEVGELAPVLPEQLKRSLSQLTGWKVKTVGKKARVRCSCGFLGRPKISAREHDVVLYGCSKCGGVPEVLEGSEVTIIEVKC